jgi:uncharacterized Zn-finger protein
MRKTKFFEVVCPFCANKMCISEGWKYCMFTQECPECGRVFTVNFGEVEKDV